MSEIYYMIYKREADICIKFSCDYILPNTNIYITFLVWDNVT